MTSSTAVVSDIADKIVPSELVELEELIRYGDLRTMKVLSPAEVAMIFRVTSKTVSRWLDSGKFDGGYFKTPGNRGHYRIFELYALYLLRVQTGIDDRDERQAMIDYAKKTVREALKLSGIRQAHSRKANALRKALAQRQLAEIS